MTSLYWILSIVAFLTIIFFDLLHNLVTRKWSAFIGLVILPHTIVLGSFISTNLPPAAIPASVFLGLTAAWFTGRLAFYLAPSPIKIGLRVRVMMGGRRIALASLLASLVQIPLCLWLFFRHENLGISPNTLTTDLILTWVLLFLCLLNGIVRIMLTSRRLGIWMRALFLVFAWVPVVNFLLGLYICRIVKKEFLHEIQQVELQEARESSQICKTRYPLLLLHGIGFRDYKYFNYWGRIPALLIRNGAEIYYGHQQAWGTIEKNAQEIKQTLLKVLEETGCEKVNIIAHSKGGLDARYLISTFGMHEHVASLTTISTPHHGSELIDLLNRLPDKAYRKIAGIIDGYFSKLGDTAPDCYAASKQLAPAYAVQFNKDNVDAPHVYYQSYASEMKAPTSDSMLMLPSALMRWVSGNNDGLVTADSAAWGNFKGVFKSATHRGISHGDVIDLMHQDYEGFNIAEEYVTIISELKDAGF